MKVGIPVAGRMAARWFHSRQFAADLANDGLQAIFLADEHQWSHRLLDLQYMALPNERLSSVEKLLRKWRRFSLPTETGELIFRDDLRRHLFSDTSISSILARYLLWDLFRRQRWLARNSVHISSRLCPPLDNRDFRSLDRIFTSGLGAAGFDTANPLIYSSQRKNIPVIATVTNYDHLSSRGFSGFIPDMFAAWSKGMAEDAMRRMGLPASKIEITGGFRFDRYLNAKAPDKELFLRKKGLDPQLRTVLYMAGSNTVFMLHFAKLLSTHFSSPATPRANVIVRTHPAHSRLYSPSLVALARLLDGGGPSAISNPDDFSSDPEHFYVEDDLEELRCLITTSDVVVNHFSTTALEAAICDIPIVYLAYDPVSQDFPFSSTYGWQARESTNRQSLRLAAGRQVFSDAQLIGAIENYLEHPELERETRHRYAISEVGYLDGRSTQRVGNLIRTVVR